jgi:threonine dehydrogenase-like Zn-dependent dehydrogenase
VWQIPGYRLCQCDVELVYVHVKKDDKDADYLRSLTPDGKGFNDVLVFVPSRPLVEQADRLLAFDGCLNFFAGPTNTEFSAEFNFYNVHYAATHVVGTSGGNTEDMLESLHMMEQGLLNPSTMITHVGGLNAVVKTTLNLPNIPGGKKLVYNHVRMPLVALEDLHEMPGEFYEGLAEIVTNHNGIWSPEAERYLLANAPRI